MFHQRSLPSLLDDQSVALRAQLPGIYDGSAAAIHDARVATRRIRELLALVPAIPGRKEQEEDVRSQYKRIGRALGSVRDVDVQIGLIRNLEAHAPQTAPSLVVVRQQHERDRQGKMRRLIKTLERVDVEALLQAMNDRRPAGIRTRLAGTGWRHQLRRLLVARTRDVHDAINHATGVYFPNRVHGARIAIKRLRYVAEIAHATGLAELTHALKALRKGQELLGDLHDRQVLIQTLAAWTDRDDKPLPHITLTIQVLESEVAESHSAYLERRGRLHEASTEIERAASSTGLPARAMALGAVAASGMLYVGRALSGSRPPQARPFRRSA